MAEAPDIAKRSSKVYLHGVAAGGNISDSGDGAAQCRRVGLAGKGNPITWAQVVDSRMLGRFVTGRLSKCVGGHGIKVTYCSLVIGLPG